MANSLSTDLRVEEHALFILFISIILILFWYSVWYFLDEFTEVLHKKYGIRKFTTNTVFLLIVLLCVGLFPQVLRKI